MSILNKNLVTGLFLIACGAVSIGVTGWQYRSHESTLDIAGSSLCHSAPFQYARPFFAYANDQAEGGNIYCGYALSNTVWRLCVAGLSIILGIVLSIPGVASGKAFKWVLFFFGAAWFCATTSDCTAIAMSYGVCRNFFGGPNAAQYDTADQMVSGTYTCDEGYYGVTIAIDFVMSFAFFLALAQWETEEAESTENTYAPASKAVNEDVTTGDVEVIDTKA